MVISGKNKKIRFIFLLIISLFLFGFGRSNNSIIWRVNTNKDNKIFSSKWEYRISSKIKRTKRNIILNVDGRKFHIKTDKNDEWIYDGKTLWQISKQDKIIYFYPLKRFSTLLFWKVPSKMSPFGKPLFSGYKKLEDKECAVLKIKGFYEGANVEISYWIDKNTGILLKKEHRIGPEKDPLWKEDYVLTELNLKKKFPSQEFHLPPLPPGYVKVKKLFLGSAFIDCKF